MDAATQAEKSGNRLQPMRKAARQGWYRGVLPGTGQKSDKTRSAAVAAPFVLQASITDQAKNFFSGSQ